MRIVLLATFCLLAACQSGRYLDHRGSDAATLVFASDDLTAQPLICAPGKGLQKTPLAIGLGGYKMLEDLNETMKKSPEVRASVATDSSVVAGFQHSQRGRSSPRKQCRVMARFDAAAGQTYRLRLEKSPVCAITVSRLEHDKWVEQETRESPANCR